MVLGTRPLAAAARHLGRSVVAVPVLAGVPPGRTANPRDPLGAYNRGMFEFNDGVDEAPFSSRRHHAYKNVTPAPGAHRRGQFLWQSDEDVWSFSTALLQGKAQAAARPLCASTSIPSRVSAACWISPAKHWCIERQPKTFGQTLGYWGVPTGPYLVLPFLGHRPCVTRWPCRSTGWPDPVIVGNLDHGRPAIRAWSALNACWTRGPTCCAPATCSTKSALDKYSFSAGCFPAARRNAMLRWGDPPEEPTKSGRDGIPGVSVNGTIARYL
jgi:phospholipid-binding lipoprotein MlaA